MITKDTVFDKLSYNILKCKSSKNEFKDIYCTKTTHEKKSMIRK